MFWGKNFGPKLDYIFVPPGTDVKNAQIIRSSVNGRFPSDHFPITSDIVLRVNNPVEALIDNPLDRSMLQGIGDGRGK